MLKNRMKVGGADRPMAWRGDGQPDIRPAVDAGVDENCGPPYVVEPRRRIWNDWLWPVLAAPFIGSFLGRVVARLPSGRSIAWSRSACDLCAHSLDARDLVPVVSWLALRGRCRYCGGKIGLRLLLIESGAPALALWAASVAQSAVLRASCSLGWMLFALALIDLDESILPGVDQG